MGLLIVTIVGTVIGTCLAVEANAWMPYLSQWLVRSTFNEMPNGLDDAERLRWEEEIEGDLGAYNDRPFGGLLFALRLRRRGGRRLAVELVEQQTSRRRSDAAPPKVEIVAEPQMIVLDQSVDLPESLLVLDELTRSELKVKHANYDLLIESLRSGDTRIIGASNPGKERGSDD